MVLIDDAWAGCNLACIASVSNRVIARKLEREQKNGGKGRGRGEEETLARTPPRDISRFGSFVN